MNKVIPNRKKKSDTNISEKEIDLDISLKEFLSKIDCLKKTLDYKKKGPFIYCVVKRDINIIFLSFFLRASDKYHVGIFECTKEVLMHYGEVDNNDNRKPLIIESLTDESIKKYKAIKYFYSKDKPENFNNLIDKNNWTSELYDKLAHNCYHCVNEFLILNNIKPINFGLAKNIAYEYLCDNCCKELGRYNMYKYNKNGYIDVLKTFYDVGEI